jgi:acyl carrier protein
METDQPLSHESFSRRHRGGMLLEKYGLDLYPHPFLGFTLAPNLTTDRISTDNDGFRTSDSPFGPVDSATWMESGGGIMLGNSVTYSLAASSNNQTIPSHLAHLTGTRQLNLGLCAAISLQEVIAAIPFLSKAKTIVVVGGGTDVVNVMGSLRPVGHYGTVAYESTFEQLSAIPLFDLAAWAAGEEVAEVVRLTSAERPATNWNLADAGQKMKLAAQRRIRDLAVLVGAAAPGTKVLFCLQPMASVRTRDITPNEAASYDFAEPVFGILQQAIEDNWPDYVAELAAGCQRLGAGFVNLSPDLFLGDSFADTVHLTDAGNAQAAALIQRALKHTSEVPQFASAPPRVEVATAVADATTEAGGTAVEPVHLRPSTLLAPLSVIVAQALGVPPEQLTPTGDFRNDYGADSLLVIDVVAHIEEELDVRIPDHEIPQMITLNSVVALVEKYYDGVKS